MNMRIIDIRISGASLLVALCAIVSLALPGTASSVPFTQCPAGINNLNGLDSPWPSCAFLLTINPDNSVTVEADTVLLATVEGPLSPVFAPEDILVGVQNNSGRAQSAVRIQGYPLAEFFVPDVAPDFPYTGNGNVFFSDLGPLTDDPDDPCLGCVNPTGTVNFVGGLSPGASTWFGLEGAAVFGTAEPITFTASAVSAASVPEPASLVLVGFGLAALGMTRRRKKP